MTYNPVICAIDTPDISFAHSLCERIAPSVGAIKLGLEFFVTYGPDGVRKLQARNIPVFLDLKLYDIPNTAAAAARAAASLNVWMMTFHASGGARMLRAVRQAVDKEFRMKNIKPPLLMGVTVLTSMEESELSALGVAHSVAVQASHLAQISKDSGMDGVICSPHEIRTIKNACGDEFLTVVPGIRPAQSNNQDQRRVMTPKEAMDQGADYLVIGRPITEAANPAEAAREIANSLR